MCGNLLPCRRLSVCLNTQTPCPLLATLAESCLRRKRAWGKWGRKTRFDVTPPISQLLPNKLMRQSILLICESQASLLQYLATLLCMEHDLN